MAGSDRSERRIIIYSVMGLTGFVLFAWAGLAYEPESDGAMAIKVLLGTVLILTAFIGFVIAGIRDVKNERKNKGRKGREQLEKTFE